ncbi:MAG: citrate lyase subunit alpha [Thermoplasmata archaeon]|nr:citrate lyase subunit alpha [Thermoplasmata archaeon]
MVKNSLGREIPERIGDMELEPFRGAFATPPRGKSITRNIWSHNPGKKKLLSSISEAIDKSGLKSGMNISFHHHLRNGDYVVVMVLEEIAKRGIKNIGMRHSSVFAIHTEAIIEHIKNGVITSFEGNLNGPLGKYISENPCKEPVVIRSHGARTLDLERGNMHIDVAFLAASASDDSGNCNGVLGESKFGPMGFAMADSWFADRVVIITDNLQPYPCTPISIPEHQVDYVVNVDNIGDPKGIATGTMKITEDPMRLKIAQQVVDAMDAIGQLEDGFSFQAGAGGMSLAVVKFLHERMLEKNKVGSFAMGGITGLVVDMLHGGTIRKILDAQAFDIPAIDSLLNDPDHVEVSHYHFGNPHSRGCITHHQDACFLGATEVDIDFNVNVNTHSDGLLLHGSGGHPDAAAGSKVTFITTPIVRKTNPIVRNAVTTITTPGECVDVIATDQGLTVNPKRKDLWDLLGEFDPVPIESLRDMAYDQTGAPEPLEYTDKFVGVIKFRDGTVTDVVREVKKED